MAKMKYWDGSQWIMLDANDSDTVDGEHASDLKDYTDSEFENHKDKDSIHLSSDEDDALSGTSGSPSDSNKFVTDEDSRMDDAREPTEHDNDKHSTNYASESEFNDHKDKEATNEDLGHITVDDDTIQASEGEISIKKDYAETDGTYDNLRAQSTTASDVGLDNVENKSAEDIRTETGTALVAEQRTSDPSSPVDGQIWIRTDLLE